MSFYDYSAVVFFKTRVADLKRHAANRSAVQTFLGIVLGGIGLITTAASPAFADGTPKQFSGKVSWYGPGFDGRKTASGEVFDMRKNTAAHLKLKFGTKVLVENPRNGKSVVVKVNDRGPYAKGRVMDISRGAAEKIGTLLGGVVFLDCTILDKDAPQSGMTKFILITDEVSVNDSLTALVPMEQRSERVPPGSSGTPGSAGLQPASKAASARLDT